MKLGDVRESIKAFFEAAVLQECRDQVEKENLRMMYLLNAATAVFSLIMGIYTGIMGSGSYAYERIYVIFFFLSIALLLFTRFVVDRYRSLLPFMIVLNYLAWVCYFAAENIFFRPAMYITAYYTLMGMGFCFLIKPLYMIMLQLLTAVALGTCIFIYEQPQYAEIDMVNMSVMTATSILLCCVVTHFRLRALKKVADGDRTLKVTALYQSVIDETQTGVYVRELGTYELLYMNRKAREIFGIDGNGEQGKKCYRIFYHQDVACAECPARQRNMDSVAPREVVLGGRYYAVKGKIIDWCGREAYVEYLTDITEVKRLNEQMRVAHDNLQEKYDKEVLYRKKSISEDVLSTCCLNLMQGIVEEMRIGEVDGYEKQCRHVTDFAERITLFTEQTWMTEEQKHRLSGEQLLASFEAGKTMISEEYIVQLRGGRHVWLRTEVNLVRRPETAEVLAFIYNRDVTKEKLLRHVLECLMSFEYDEIYTVDESNERFLAMAIGQYALEDQQSEGYYQDELECLVERAVSDEDKEKLRQEMSLEGVQRHLQTEAVFALEVSLVSRNGKVRRKQIRCMYLNQEIGVLLITLTDIEDVVKQEKEKQEQLQQALLVAKEASKAKSNFLASMSHEIRTPMNAIIGLNAIIKSEIENREQVLDCTEKLDSASKYLLALLNDILDMSRIESGNMTLAHQPFGGDKFWENVNILAHAQADMASVHYIFKREEEVSRVYIGDATRLQQIMINLINNAIKFTPEDGYVKVAVTEKERADARAAISVTVEDNGIGISKEFLPEVFGTFTQQYDGSTTAYKGSGLGLSIARNFARMMDGDITVESREGIGTTFTVEVLLDVDKEQELTEEGEEQEEGRDFTGKKVLLVEDHPLNTIVAKGLLEKRGFEVVHAENGAEALRYFAESEVGSFDAVLMDIRMPVMDGIEATMKIRELQRMDAKAVPIIAMTANAYEEDRRRTANAGMDAHLAKPIDPRQLFRTLDNFINET